MTCMSILLYEYFKSKLLFCSWLKFIPYFIKYILIFKQADIPVVNVSANTTPKMKECPRRSQAKLKTLTPLMADNSSGPVSVLTIRSKARVAEKDRTILTNSPGRSVSIYTKPPECVDVIRHTSRGFPSWCPGSTSP